MPYYIRELNHGANILLGHFHYCNKGSHPFSFPSNVPPSVAELNQDQIQLLVRTNEYFKARGKFDLHSFPPGLGPPVSPISPPILLLMRKSYLEEWLRKAKENGFFEEEMYSVSQLLEQDWQPGPSV